MGKLNEIFTYPTYNNSDLAQEAVNNYECRFTGKTCDKQSRLINYPMGVCSVQKGDKKPIICPNRFLEDNIVFRNICESAFGTTDNILLFKEVKLKDVGTFDFVLVKHKPISSQVEDFCVVEFQSDSTTGTGKLVNALKEFMNGDDLPKKSYAFGMNTYNTIKLSYIQMLMKGQVMESWNKKIFWVMQDFVYDNMVKRFNLVDLKYNENLCSQYHVYDLEMTNDLNTLTLKEKRSTTVSNLITAFTHQPTPSVEKFISKLQERVDLKVGLSLNK